MPNPDGPTLPDSASVPDGTTITVGDPEEGVDVVADARSIRVA